MTGPAARDEILARIRSALADGPAPVVVPRRYAHGGPSGADVIAQFAERVADYRATVHRIAGGAVGAVATTIDAVLRDHRVRTIVTPSGLPAGWLATATVEAAADDPPLSHAALDAVDAVITGCAVAVAETGTIILDGGSGQGRRAVSLLPDLHVCVVAASQIVGSVPEAIARLDPRRPQTWISGPSATSDIELQRVEGVHGPRRLVVLIAED